MPRVEASGFGQVLQIEEPHIRLDISDTLSADPTPKVYLILLNPPFQGVCPVICFGCNLAVDVHSLLQYLCFA